MEKYKNKNNQDQNKEYIKISREGLRRLGTTALTFGAVSGALGGWFGHDIYKNHQESESQKIFEMSSVKKRSTSAGSKRMANVISIMVPLNVLGTSIQRKSWT